VASVALTQGRESPEVLLEREPGHAEIEVREAIVVEAPFAGHFADGRGQDGSGRPDTALPTPDATVFLPSDRRQWAITREVRLPQVVRPPRGVAKPVGARIRMNAGLVMRSAAFSMR
jgi:hypothetical protein